MIKIKLKLSFSGFVSLILLTILLVLDFFSDYSFLKYLNNGYLFWVLLIALGFFMSFDSKSKYKNTFQNLFLPIYIVSLLLILTFIGGNSIHGLSATQGPFWIIVALCVIDIIPVTKRKGSGN